MEEVIVYGDVLAAVNFMVDLCLLKLVSRLSGVFLSRFRRICGAMAGAVASFSIFLPVSGAVPQLLLRIAVTAAVILAAWGGEPVGVLLKLGVLLFSAGFLVAGGVCGLYFLFPAAGFAAGGGGIYLPVSPALLFGATAVSWLGTQVFQRVFRRDGFLHPYRLTLERGGERLTLDAFPDTGCRLREPFSGLPAAVAGLDAVSGLLDSRELLAVISRAEPPETMRLIAGQGVSETLLWAVKPERALLEWGGERREVELWLAVTENPVRCGGCRMIFPPELLPAGCF